MGRIGGFAKPSVRAATSPLALYMDAALILQVSSKLSVLRPGCVRERESARERERERERESVCVFLHTNSFACIYTHTHTHTHTRCEQNKGGGHGEIGFHIAKQLRAKGSKGCMCGGGRW